MLAMLAELDMVAAAKSTMFIVLPIVGSVLLAFGVFQVAMDLRGSEQRKLMARLEDRTRRRKDAIAKQSILRRDATKPAEGTVSAAVAKLSVVPRLQRLLDEANVPWAASRTLMNLFGFATLGTAGLFLMKVSPVFAIAAGLGVVCLPLLWLVWRRKRRINRLMDQLPDVFDLLAQALRAGHSLASGIQMVGENMPDPMGTEFTRVFHEQNLGIKIEDCLKNMADRNGQMDLRFFVTAVLVQRQTGGDLAEVLDKIGSIIRERIQLYGMVQALTAEGRLSGWVLLALPVVVFCAELGLNPDYAGDLLWDPTGRFLLYGAGALQLMGMAMIKKIVSIKV